MIIWALALGILAFVALVGYYQGAIRVIFSTIGIVVAALLAIPLGRFIKPVIAWLGADNPLVLTLLAPFVVFVLIMVGFKVFALSVDRKFEYTYRYQRSDAERFAFERLNSRLGLCLGLVNGTFYFFLILIPIYVLGYLTVQLGGSSDDPTGLKVVNQVRQGIHDSRLDRAIASYDPAPPEYYAASDVIGLVRHNPALQQRLFNYPSLLTITERKELQELANDQELGNLLQGKASIGQVVDHPKVQAVLTNEAVLADFTALKGDLQDLRSYLTTGNSAKYDEERILGRWVVDVDASLQQTRRKVPNMPAVAYNNIRNSLTTSPLTLVAGTDNRVILRSPNPNPGAGEGPTRVVSEGSWKKMDRGYEITFNDGRPETTAVQLERGERLVVTKGGITMVFNRQG
jgi:hypothetical protein